MDVEMASFYPKNEMATLYVANLHPSLTKDQLYENFTRIGSVSSISIRTESLFGNPHCYAFVEFLEVNDAKCALETLNLEIGIICPTYITWYKPDAGKVFIQNLDKGIDNKILYETFSIFGNIFDCKIATNFGKPLGIAFIHYETEYGANTCIKFYHGFRLKDQNLHIEKYNIMEKHEKVLNDKEKLVIKIQMAVRNSIFKSDEVCEQPNTDDDNDDIIQKTDNEVSTLDQTETESQSEPMTLEKIQENVIETKQEQNKEDISTISAESNSFHHRIIKFGKLSKEKLKFFFKKFFFQINCIES